MLSACASEVGDSVPETVVGVSQDAFESGGAGAAALAFEGADELVDKSAGLPTRINIKTGCVANAGTYAKAKLRFCQKINKADCGWKDTVNARLSPDDGSFTKCTTDRFPEAYVDPAWTVTWVELSHDNTGSGPGWYVEYVDLEVPFKVRPTDVDHWWYVYRCTFNRWLSSTDGLKASKGCVERPGFYR
jgi:hypothetical protein